MLDSVDRKEVASIFSPLQSPNRMFSLGRMYLTPDLIPVTRLSLFQGSYVDKVSLILFSEHHQGGHSSCYQSHLITKAPYSYIGWCVLILCSIWVGLLTTHTTTHTTTTTTHLNFYGRFCSSLVYLTPPALLDVQENWGFPLIGCFLLIQTQKRVKLE